MAAGKAVEELQRRGLLQSAIGAAAAAEKKRKEMMEELARGAWRRTPAVAAARTTPIARLWDPVRARLNPALLPGRFAIQGHDHCRHAGSAGSVLPRSRPCRLRDGRAFSQPSNFDSTQDLSALMFRGSSLPRHLPCARAGREICQILFSQPGIRLSRHPPAGCLVGPFPRRLDLEFDATARPRPRT
jgi:hypothetical protein